MMFIKTYRVCLVVLGRGTASAVSAVGIGSGGHNVPHILSSYRPGCSHHQRPIRTTKLSTVVQALRKGAVASAMDPDAKVPP